MKTHLSTLVLHRLRYGELSKAERSEVRAHLKSCDRCAAMLRAQENHRAAFELRPVPEAIRELSGTPEPANAPWRWRRWLAAGVALAAAVLLAVVVVPDLGGVETGMEVVRAKGGSGNFEAWLDTPAGPRPMSEDEILHAGDRIQVRFRRPTQPWVSLAGIDASGNIEVYGTWIADMDTPDWQLAPFALELDNSPGDQDLVLLMTPKRPPDAVVRAVVNTGEALPGAELRSLLLEKVP
ncbi:MAG: zf-HC2 domain-containing protein [Deltaproteobacteria bacterium]|nr:zf-HC2 domain-containing protein [Deltaproteobacteria bacterium]MBW2258417.1 zf-HC2 domain-containing protein [Deltaproteobacteria bacterium]